MHIRGIFVCLQRTTILVKAVLKFCILMGLIFYKRFTNRHNLLMAEAPLSPPHTILDKAIYKVVY